MAALLRVSGATALLVAAALAASAVAAETSDRHRWRVEIDAGYVGAHSALRSWTEGGLSKLRYAENDDGMHAARVFVEYRGRITPTLSTTIVADYVDDASTGLDVTEAFVDWRPIPTSGNQQQLRLGLFYPPLSLENVDPAWESPFSYSYSAINTWLGEEIRPMGAEWSLRRRLGFAGSPHELRVFVGGFYGNDPAGTLLFWRGWSLHDRQTRLNDVLSMPPRPIFGPGGTIVALRPQSVEPFEEIDHEPGAYAGVEWRYSRRLLLQLARYDNRADPNAFSDGQWGWETAFTQLGIQVSLPWELGLVAQWLEGDTYWISGTRPNGTVSPFAEHVEDAFDARYLLLTRELRGAHRVSVRYDDFAMPREGAVPAFTADAGTAWTVAYRYRATARWTGGVEWLRIESKRDLWTEFYAVDHRETEEQVRLQVTFRLGAPATR
jgi:opacity protein-like surface antigen